MKHAIQSLILAHIIIMGLIPPFHRAAIAGTVAGVFISLIMCNIQPLYIGVTIAFISIIVQFVKGIWRPDNIILLPVMFAWYILLYMTVSAVIYYVMSVAG